MASLQLQLLLFTAVALICPAHALVPCPIVTGHDDNTGTAIIEFARALSSSNLDVAAVLKEQQLLAPEVLALAGWQELRSLGIPLGAALQIQRCFPPPTTLLGHRRSSGSQPQASGLWGTLRVTSTSPLIVSAGTTVRLNVTTAVVVEDGGTINIQQGAKLFISGSFEAPLQRIFVGEGQVFMKGDRTGRLYPQWWGAVADGSIDADRAIQAAVDAATVPLSYNGSGTLCRHCAAAADNGGLSGTVFLPPGLYSVGKPIELPDGAVFEGAGSKVTFLIANATSNPPAILAPPNHGLNRTDGWRLSKFNLRGAGRAGTGKSSSGSGILLVQTSRAVVSDIAISYFDSGLRMNGAWNGGSDDGHGHGHGAIPCMCAFKVLCADCLL
eukprot:COSAG01_NODE_1066_length_11878_cov_244.494949_18_plen_384_part_00